MAAPTRPAAAKVYGKEKWLFAAALSAPPKVTELTGTGTIDMSCYFYDDTARPSVTQDGVTAPKRICDTQQFQSMGTAQWGGGNAMYAVDPQADAGDDGKKALEALPEGTTGWLIKRVGVAVDTDFATGDFVSAYPVEFGVPVDVTEGDGEAAEAAIQQAYVITGPPQIIVSVVAGT
jgi:hypothetical protein